MIRVNPAQRTVRETSAEFEHTDPETGELRTDKIRVRYFSPTAADLKKQTDISKERAAKEETYWLYEELAEQLESLPDLVDEKDEPHKITEEFLSGLSLTNLRAISNAITAEVFPKEKQAK